METLRVVLMFLGGWTSMARKLADTSHPFREWQAGIRENSKHTHTPAKIGSYPHLHFCALELDRLQ